MSTLVVVLIIVAAIILIALVTAVGGRRARDRRLQRRRVEAAEHRERAGIHAGRAERERAEAVRHEERARELDPDVDETRRRGLQQPQSAERQRAPRQGEDRGPHRPL